MLQLLGVTFFAALVGAFAASRGRMPWRVFVAAWGIAFFCAFAAGLVMLAAGASQEAIDSFGHLLVPAVAAWFFVRRGRGKQPT